MLRTSAHNHAVPLLRSMLNHALRNFDNGLAVDQVKFGRVNAPLITSAHKGFKKPVIERVRPFLARLDYRLGASRESRDLLGQQLVPQLPAKTSRQELRDFASAASVFPLDRDDLDHRSCRLPQNLLSLKRLLIRFAYVCRYPN